MPRLVTLLSSFAAAACGACLQVPRTTAFDPGLSRTEVDGYAFHTETYGQPTAPPVIVIHGGPGGDMHYLLSLGELGDEYFVLFYDQRGTGLSPREDPAGHTIERFLADLDALVRLHGRGRPVRLIGHSWGAMLAIAYAAQHPERVSHLVAAEPGIIDQTSAREFITALKASQSLRRVIGAIPLFLSVPFVRSEDGHERSDFVMTKLLGRAAGPPYQCPGESLPEGAFLRAGYASFDRMLAPLMNDPSLWDRDLAAGMERFPGRVLLLSSECSFIGYEFQERLHRARFPAGAEHIRLSAAGHNMFTLHPAPAIRAVRAFLAK